MFYSYRHFCALGLPLARLSVVAGMAGLLAACSGFGGSGLDPLPSFTPQASVQPPANAPVASANTIGTGQVRVALLLPLSAPGVGTTVAASMRNAAELAVTEFNAPNITILVKDDKGTPDGARSAAREALGEGAELILGPLLAPTVQAAGEVARQAGKPTIAFSSDSSVAARGLYLLSFLPESDVERIVSFAASRGKRSYSALIPETAYGNVMATAFQQAVARNGGRVVNLERYTPGPKLAAAAKRIGEGAAEIDALFVPESGDSMGLVAKALTANRVDTKRVQLLGTGVWNDPRSLRLPELAGGWFSAPEVAGFQDFARRYKTRYNADPARYATLAFDATTLAIALVTRRGADRFSEPTLQSPSGFAGTDGVFRFRADGLNERGLAIMQAGNGAAQVLSPAPRTFGKEGT